MSEAVARIGDLEVVLGASGAAWLPRTRTLVISDLHLETGSAFARRGTLLPPYDTMATLARLEAVLRAWQPATVVSLGDGFHDRHGAASLSPAAYDALRALMEGVCWVWITGNHDPTPPAALGGAVLAELDVDGVVLRHVPGGRGRPEIAGHLHPKARVVGRRLKVARPCFATDGTRLLMPAFGSLTGGLNALDPAVTSLFAGPFDAWLVGERRVFQVPHDRLVAEPAMYRSVPWGMVGGNG